MSMLIGRWGDWSLEACGLLKFRASVAERSTDLGESQVQAYIKAGQTSVRRPPKS